MKHATLFLALSISILPVNNIINSANDDANAVFKENRMLISESNTLSLQQPGEEKMTALMFKRQEFCRAELKDFEFDIEYKVMSATVYFSGTNFKSVEVGEITSNSLKPIKKYMDRCAAGSMIIFDNVKVKGPDELVRPIAGMSIILH